MSKPEKNQPTKTIDTLLGQIEEVKKEGFPIGKTLQLIGDLAALVTTKTLSPKEFEEVKKRLSEVFKKQDKIL